MQCGSLHTHQTRKARLRSMRNIHNSHQVTAKKLLSKCKNLILRGGPDVTVFPRATKHGADEEAITASVEWIMVRMDLLAYCK